MKVLCIDSSFTTKDDRKWHPKKGRVYTVSMAGPDHVTLLEDTDRDVPGATCSNSVCWPDGRWPFFASRFVEVDDSVRHLTARERLEKYDPHMINPAFIEGWNDGIMRLMDSYEEFNGFEEGEK